jgi:hypothetical protein
MAYQPDAPLGAAIRVARLVRGKSVSDVSRGSGVPEHRIRAFEKGVAPPAPEFYPIWNYLTQSAPAAIEPRASEVEVRGSARRER